MGAGLGCGCALLRLASVETHELCHYIDAVAPLDADDDEADGCSTSDPQCACIADGCFGADVGDESLAASCSEREVKSEASDSVVGPAPQRSAFLCGPCAVVGPEDPALLSFESSSCTEQKVFARNKKSSRGIKGRAQEEKGRAQEQKVVRRNRKSCAGTESRAQEQKVVRRNRKVVRRNERSCAGTKRSCAGTRGRAQREEIVLLTYVSWVRTYCAYVRIFRTYVFPVRTYNSVLRTYVRIVRTYVLCLRTNFPYVRVPSFAGGVRTYVLYHIRTNFPHVGGLRTCVLYERSRVSCTDLTGAHIGMGTRFPTRFRGTESDCRRVCGSVVWGTQPFVAGRCRRWRAGVAVNGPS